MVNCGYALVGPPPLSNVGPVDVQPQEVPDCVNMWFGQDIVGLEVYILLNMPNDFARAYLRRIIVV